MFKNIKVIGFDADDTLWVNEPYFKELEDTFCKLLNSYLPNEDISKNIFNTEMKNLEIYGYGVKAFILSLIETAINISNKKVPVDIIQKIIDLGKQQLNKPIELLEGVEKVLHKLFPKNYKLIVATKGDLLDQERKLEKSGLEKYFHHIEIMSDKKETDYKKLLNHLEINSSAFAMVGNSVKSDILPVVGIGGKGIHVPYHTTWKHENMISDNIDNSSFIEVKSISEILNYL